MANNQIFDEVQRARKYVKNLVAGDVIKGLDKRLYTVITPFNGQEATLRRNDNNQLYRFGIFDFPCYQFDGKIKNP